jgi:hypothetical protein
LIVKHPCFNPRLLIVIVFLVFAPACGDAGEDAISPAAATDVIDARSAVLDYLRNTNPDAPPASLSWVDESPTNTGLPGWTESRFAADDWVMVIGVAVIAPEARRYEVSVTNPVAQFDWEGRVYPTGEVAEGSKAVLGVCDTAVAHIEEHYPDSGISSAMAWAGGRTTSEGLVGSESYAYSAEQWQINISSPVVAPEAVLHQVAVHNPTIGFDWEGTVDAAGQIAETVIPDGSGPSEVTFDRRDARDAAIEYVAQQAGIPPVDGSVWQEERTTQEGLIGAEAYRYTHQAWAIEVRYPVVAPENLSYEIKIVNTDLDIDWSGTVDAQGFVEVTPES